MAGQKVRRMAVAMGDLRAETRGEATAALKDLQRADPKAAWRASSKACLRAVRMVVQSVVSKVVQKGFC